MICGTLTLVACTDLTAKPANELRASHVELLFTEKAPDFERPLLAILLDDDNPTVVVIFVLCKKIFKGRGIDGELSTDLIRPQFLEDFDANSAQNGGIKACNKHIALPNSVKR